MTLRPMKQSHNRQRGFTLIEAVTVLVVLVALAGIAITTLPNLVQQAHRGTGASDMSNLNNVVNQFAQFQGEHPNNLDSLRTDIAAADSIPAIIPATATPDVLQSVQLSTGKLASLNAIGLTDVVEHGAGNATFESADINGTVATLTDTSYVTALGSIGMTTFGNVTPPAADEYCYAVFGVGKQCSMTGVTLQEPPTHFETNNPGEVYSRYVIVYKVHEDGSAAEFLGAGAMHENNVVPAWKAYSGFRANQFN